MLGFINVFKTRGITSHDVVDKVRKIAGIKQVGHGGTLDPLAEGVMIVAVGKATRLLQFVRDDKVYLAEILLGVQTDTDDLEGEVISRTDDFSHITSESVEQHVKQFLGKQLQVPPIYSAIKKGGMKMYDLARRGEAPEVIESREIEIFSIETVSIDLPVIKARIACSKGTYIRSIARDLGSRLGVGGSLKSLLRERSGPFHVANSLTPEQLAELRDQNKLGNAILSLDATLDLAVLKIDRECARRVMNGQAIDAAMVNGEMIDTRKEPGAATQEQPKGRRQSDEDIYGRQFRAAHKDYYIFSLAEKPIAFMKRCRDSNGDRYKPEVVLTNAADVL